MKEKYGFVYIWYDRKHKRYYIGQHWGTEDDGYICSSSWMNQAYKRRSNDFKRRILKSNIKDKKELLIEEYRYLSMIKKEELKHRYYNLSNRHFGHWSSSKQSKLTVGQKISKTQIGRKLSQETKDKIGTANKTKLLGYKRSEQSKEKMSLSKKGTKHSLEHINKRIQSRKNNGKEWITKEHKQKLINSRLGSIHSDESKQKMSDKLKGRISPMTGKFHSEETKNKIRATKLKNREINGK